MPILNPDAVLSGLTSSADSDPLSDEQREAIVRQQQEGWIAKTTNSSKSDAETLDKYTRNDSVIDTSGIQVDERQENRQKNVALGVRTVPGVEDGAEKKQPFSPKISFIDVNGNNYGKDLRVRIRVPQKYLTGLASPLVEQGGILFPYTPQITHEVSGDYGQINPMHSNFSIMFYQRSRISNIQITGKFTVQNNDDAIKFISTKFLLQALTKMRSGGAKGGDPDSGAPPPVCRLSGYGDMMFNNVPVSIQSFRLDLNDGIDYVTCNAVIDGQTSVFSVPTMTTFTVNCVPMYSRAEMQEFSVTGYLRGGDSSKGFI